MGNPLRMKHAEAHPSAGDSAGMDRCLDLRLAIRPPSGCRTRCKRPQAIPVSQRIPQSARPDEVRADVGVRNGAARIRKRIEEDLKLPGLPKNKVLATVVKPAGEDVHAHRQR